MPNTTADLEAVIVSCDTQLLHIVTKGLHDSGVEAKTFDDANAANNYISTRKVDAVIVDSEIAGATNLLRRVRETPSNSRTPTFATIHTRELYGELAASAHFIMEKPLSQEHFDRALRAAHDLMLLERRRYHRQPLEIPITVAYSNGEFFSTGAMINLSEHGFALRCERPLNRRELLEVQFVLPGLVIKFRCSVEVVWGDSDGTGGVRFLALEKRYREALTKWIDQELAREGRQVPRH